MANRMLSMISLAGAFTACHASYNDIDGINHTRKLKAAELV